MSFIKRNVLNLKAQSGEDVCFQSESWRLWGHQLAEKKNTTSVKSVNKWININNSHKSCSHSKVTGGEKILTKPECCKYTQSNRCRSFTDATIGYNECYQWNRETKVAQALKYIRVQKSMAQKETNIQDVPSLLYKLISYKHGKQIREKGTPAKTNKTNNTTI